MKQKIDVMALLGLIVAVLSCIATWIAVPQVQSLFSSPTVSLPTGNPTPVENPGGQNQTTNSATSPASEIIQIVVHDVGYVFGDELSIQFDGYSIKTLSDIHITVKSKGYVREVFDGLDVGNEIIYAGKMRYKIVLSDFDIVDGALNKAFVELVVTKLE